MRFKYRFTVFTPCYNSEKTLHRVFESLMAQTIDHSAFEWLVINDASTDGTDRLIRRFIEEADFDVRYINRKQNVMLIKNIREAIDKAQGELFAGIGHDDRMAPDAIETFCDTWDRMTEKEKRKCASIVCLSRDQNGNRVGNAYPRHDCFVSSLEYTLDILQRNIGENWGAQRSDILKKYYEVPPIIDEIRYIPESFFWNKMAFELAEHGYRTYLLNKPLRIYYREGNGANLSQNIRARYPEGFEYESLYFLNHHVATQWRHSPKFYLKHLIKYVIFSHYNGKSFTTALKRLNNAFSKTLFVLAYPAILFEKRFISA